MGGAGTMGGAGVTAGVGTMGGAEVTAGVGTMAGAGVTAVAAETELVFKEKCVC